MQETSKKTPLHAAHERLGARMVPFAGYLMPIKYTSETEEHHAVRTAAGLFDVSHMGEFMITGPGALNLIQKVASNDAAQLVDGQAQYACLPNEQGGIVDDLIVYRLAAEKYMLVVNASNIQKDWDWISRHNDMGATMQDISEETALLALQGPAAGAILQALTDVEVHTIKFYHFRQGTVAGIGDVIVSATGYTGEPGFELYVHAAEAEKLWEALMEAGKEHGLLPAGLGARDTLRMEMGYCLYGNDIDDTTSPIAAGLGWITKFSKDFIHADALKKEKENGPEEKLIGFVMEERGIPRQGYPIVDAQQRPIGRVTSGTQSPSLQQGIGMGYVKSDFSAAGTVIYIGVRNKFLKATVARFPFYKK